MIFDEKGCDLMPKLRHPSRNTPHRKLSRLLHGYRGADQQKTMETLSGELGLCTDTVRKYLKNPGEAPLKYLTKLSDVLGVPIEELRSSIHYSGR